MDFMEEILYLCTSKGCGKKLFMQENLKKHVKVHDQEKEKCQRKRKRPMNEHESALKEVNKALRSFTKTVHSNDAPYTRCYECNEFKRHINFMLHFKLHFKFVGNIKNLETLH